VKKEIARNKTPEEQELEIKQADVAVLSEDLSCQELELITLQAQLQAFQGQYYRVVGVKYVILDDLKAKIAEQVAKLKPENKKAQDYAKEARRHAQESARVSEEIAKRTIKDFKSNESIRSLYKKLALLCHPDRTTDLKEKERLHHIMADINRAYSEGNEIALLKILEEWESSPDSIKGEGAGAELVRVIRKIAQIKRRLHEINNEITKLKDEDLYKLEIKVAEVKKFGRDLLKEMADQIDIQIMETKEELNLKK
jgi:hypothetical protein